MKDIIIGIIITVITTIIIALGTYFIKLIQNEIKRRFDVLEKRLDALSCTDDKYKDDNKVIISTLFAVLDGLVQMGANGIVNETREKLRKHLIDKKD